MNIEINPFYELYVTETATPREFVKLFSPLPAKHAQLLFQHGNVVLKGTQGTGKSMLLNLLKPEIRKAFYKEKTPFPVSGKLTDFFGAGINLTRCGALDIGQRPISEELEKEEMLFPLYFSDFFNYWIVRDILKSIEFISNNPDVFNKIIDEENLDRFAIELSKESCWFGYFKKINRFDELASKLDERISVYRQFNQYNIDKMPTKIIETKTGIGEPISRAADCLLKTNVIKEGTQIYVRVDQYEILYRSHELRPKLGKYYRQMINKALSTRDPNISYRIGTRSYAWEEDITVYGTSFRLEKERDYREIDLDEILRRKEDSRTWRLPDFAADVFRRRLENSGYIINDENPIRTVFGKSPSPETLASKYAGTSRAYRALRIDDDWPDVWKRFLEKLYQDSPLSSILAQAWAMQKGTESRFGIRLEKPPPQDSKSWERTYWRKERIRQALMQIASKCGQRLMWWGDENILSLSMGSILIFISICQHIWDTFLRSERGRPTAQKKHPILDGIDGSIQVVAVQTASDYWYKKIVEQPGGTSRQRFIEYLGRLFQRKLLNDSAMSYPGHNGFSLKKKEYDADFEVARFLGDAVDYGDLFSSPHTTKTPDRYQRIKWYLNPILSPHFKIPESHIKEPIYISITEVRKWMKESKIPIKDSNEKVKKQSLKDNAYKKQQLKLFTHKDRQ